VARADDRRAGDEHGAGLTRSRSLVGSSMMTAGAGLAFAPGWRGSSRCCSRLSSWRMWSGPASERALSHRVRHARVLTLL
jgi:hypothetical protein